MDPRDRADALLARARARGAFVVTPDNATSPMDSSNTQQIPRSVVTEIDRANDPDTTTQLPASMIEDNDHHLARHQPTKRLEVERRPQATAPLPNPAPRTKPMTVPLPVARRPEPAQESQEEQVTGLIPTTTQSTGVSDLSRRLDGI